MATVKTKIEDLTLKEETVAVVSSCVSLSVLQNYVHKPLHRHPNQ